MRLIKTVFLGALLAPMFVQADPVEWDTVLKNPLRTEANRARDVYRHPKETLEFFEIEDDKDVLEIWPSLGWYSEILAPALQKKGSYSVAHFNPESRLEFLKKARAAFGEKIASKPEAYKKVKIYTLELPDNDLPSASFDHVITFRNVHNWMRLANTDEMFRAFYASLRPGGILGVVEHRAPANFNEEQQIKSGYVTEEYVKTVAAAAGFEFIGGSDINNNSKDTKDYPKGVWTLPPTFALGDENKEKYQAIGESDRFTLKFRKPLKSANKTQGAR